jgi:hypothetical protein
MTALSFRDAHIKCGVKLGGSALAALRKGVAVVLETTNSMSAVLGEIAEILPKPKKIE